MAEVDSLKILAEVVINEVYKSISLESNPALYRVKHELKAYRLQTSNLDNRLDKLELKLDDIS